VTAPASTYRVQVHGGFPLTVAAEIAPYLAALGVGALYSAPILASTEGSTHGYDVVAHDCIDDGAGGRSGLDALSEALRRNGLRLLLDVVPNHVSVAPPASANAWWWDVLKHGRESRYARAFDVDWAVHDGRVLLPVLGAPLAEVLARGEIVREGDVLRYHEHVWPIAPGTDHHDDVADLLVRQHYLPEHWRRGSHDLNYRRFFDVSTLAGLRVEQPEVFAESHALVVSLVRDGVVDGLRIDHPDGLADPRTYLSRLRDATGGVWTVVEKVEALPDGWDADGTTGYDALADLTGLFVDPDGEDAMTRLYAAFTGEPGDWQQVADTAKRLVLTEILGSEVEWLHRLVPHEPRAAIVELLVALDTYRAEDAATLDRAVARVPAEHQDAAARLASYVTDGAHPAFATRFHQTSGPAAAKGIEDTAMYRYARLLSLNEVGSTPGRFGIALDEFHARAGARARTSMTTLSTHDTKRSEDVRARISLLAQVPAEWGEAVRRWSRLAQRYGDIGGNLEYLLYQTFVGAYPLDPERAVTYAVKAAREAKQRTSWLDPDEAYEADVERWVRGVLSDEELTADLDAFVAPLVRHGRVASLAQKLVQLTMPGVPDVYQGNEVWDYSLVDPDNRRPVDYASRAALLAELDSLDAEQVLARADEGLPKLLVTSRALRLRQARPAAFAGSYDPLAVTGAWTGRVVAFARGGEVVTVVPRLTMHVDDWKDTAVALPPGGWRDVLTGAAVASGAVADLFARFPVALLERA
jgi:(1->4)-alpha-D-glucan 1-alpha-D-glucosylmutase